jgi:hypothetical protein
MKTKLLFLLAAAMLAGCGGGDDPPVVVDDRMVPTSATSSPTAYAEYVGTRPVEDLLEPLLVQGLMPPATDEDEPLPLR